MTLITSAVGISRGGYLGNANANTVISVDRVNIIVVVTEEYLEKVKIPTNVNAQSKIRKNKPSPIPSILGPSSKVTKPSFWEGEDILFLGICFKTFTTNYLDPGTKVLSFQLL